MKMIWVLLGLLHFNQPAYSLSPLQILIDVTPAGGTLKPLPGTYAGPLVIKHPITLDGQGQVSIDAQGEGTVLTVKADGSVVRNLHLVNSGHSHDQVNAPIQPENIAFLRRNLFAYNEAAMFFYGDRGGHVIEGNRFNNNHTDVLVSSASSALDNKWLGNVWDSYEGFDQDRDGIGDTPHNLYIYADRLWMDTPMARFYRGTPALELVDFVERLAPFSEPKLILQDARPSVKDRTN